MSRGDSAIIDTTRNLFPGMLVMCSRFTRTWTDKAAAEAAAPRWSGHRRLDKNELCLILAKVDNNCFILTKSGKTGWAYPNDFEPCPLFAI